MSAESLSLPLAFFRFKRPAAVLFIYFVCLFVSPSGIELSLVFRAMKAVLE